VVLFLLLGMVMRPWPVTGPNTRIPITTTIMMAPVVVVLVGTIILTVVVVVVVGVLSGKGEEGRGMKEGSMRGKEEG